MRKQLARLLRSRITLLTAMAALLAIVSGASYSSISNQSSGAARPSQSGDVHVVLPGGLHAVLTATTWGPIKLPYYSGRCLDAETDAQHNPNQNGDHVQIWACNGRTNQNWHLIARGGSLFYFFENEYGNHLVLDAENDQYFNPSQNGDPIQLWTLNDQCQQAFKPRAYGSGVGLLNACTSGKAIDASTGLPGGPMVDGDKVQLWTYLYHTNQIWTVP